VPDFAMRSTWTRCRPNCCRWSTRRSSRPRPRCGFDHRRDRWGVAEGESPHPIRHERLHAMQFRAALMSLVRGRACSSTILCTDRDCPLDTARARSLWHAAGTAAETTLPRGGCNGFRCTMQQGASSVTTVSLARAEHPYPTRLKSSALTSRQSR
jgi:hypothetical protein